MDLSVKERVHVMPVGYEYDRIILTAERFRADRVCLISHEGNGSDGHRYLAEAHRALEERNIQVEIAFCDLFDFYDSIGSISEFLKKYEDDDTYVNIATGSKVTAVAGFIAATILDVPAYYGRAADYSETPAGLEEVFELPNYHIDAPDEDQMLIIAALHDIAKRDEAPPTKGQLIHIAEHNSLRFTRRDVDEKGLYRLLDSEVLEPLLDRGYIEVYKDGRNKRVTLTEPGKEAFRAFRTIIPEYEIDHGTLYD